MESLLEDKEVLSAMLEQQLKKAITFDPTVGSRSNCYTGFRRLFSLGYLWNQLLSDEMVWSANLEFRLEKAINFDPMLDRAKIFTRVSKGRFPWVAMESLLDDEEVWSARLE
jgi:hypothetical protein